ncbi:hypothetical protein GCM10007385_18210 [Tateyamaria omphalii]|uniref:hypothetical protein n=1 Tax=Tateyamaria omphalii TaxID=299262 RepID=UPI00167305B6|nr:hypothetical protein [Tateyamaria omphalii]GGX50181.1 hypothetical protein GCM10007385_18210 [Tateyamaria omphalii]
MKRIVAVCTLTALVAACGNGPRSDEPDSGGDPAPEDNTPDPNTGTRSVFFGDGTSSSNLTVNNVVFDPASDTLVINNIPFDDPDNQYVRITTENFVGSGFDAYQSDPAPGTGEQQYFAIFRRSDTGNSQVTAATSAEFIGFGFGGAGAQRLGADPTLPLNGILTYNGEYGAVRTVLNGVGNGDRVEYVTGDAQLTADFGDFDEVGAVEGRVTNRVLYDDTGAQIATLSDSISLANGEIDFDNGLILSTDAVLLDATGTIAGNGNWEGVFAGPNGEEIAGIVVLETTDNTTREIGGIVANR